MSFDFFPGMSPTFYVSMGNIKNNNCVGGTLHMGDKRLGDAGAVLLADALKKNTNLTDILLTW